MEKRNSNSSMATFVWSFVLSIVFGSVLSSSAALAAERLRVAQVLDCRMPASVIADSVLPGLVGTVLNESDTVRVSQGGQVTLLFKDGAVQKIDGPAVIIVQPQASHEKGLIAHLVAGLAELVFPAKSEVESVRLAVRGPDTTLHPTLTIPVLMYPPSGTAFRNTPDHLEWLPIAGATSYSVSLYDKSGLIWQQDTKTPRLSHPFDSLNLAGGGAYFWHVAADLGNSSLESEESVFWLLDTLQCEQISDALKEINGLRIDSRTAALLEVNLYRNHHLLIDEMRAVDALLNQAPDDMAALIMKAQLYEEMSRYHEADTCLRRALKL
jgi:hypothetical protein